MHLVGGGMAWALRLCMFLAKEGWTGMASDELPSAAATHYNISPCLSFGLHLTLSTCMILFLVTSSTIYIYMVRTLSTKGGLISP